MNALASRKGNKRFRSLSQTPAVRNFVNITASLKLHFATFATIKNSKQQISAFHALHSFHRIRNPRMSLNFAHMGSVADSCLNFMNVTECWSSRLWSRGIAGLEYSHFYCKEWTFPGQVWYHVWTMEGWMSWWTQRGFEPTPCSRFC